MTLRMTHHLPTLTAFALSFAFMLAVAPAVAMPVYKCVADDGKVTYSQNPCYGEQWHRLGEARAQRKPASETATPPKAPEKAASAPAAATTPATSATAATAGLPAATAPSATASTTRP